MSGFLNYELNKLLQKNAFEQISEYVIQACERVIQNYENRNLSLCNNENEIRNVLLNDFLDADDIRNKFDMSGFRFEPENSENYNAETRAYIGRTDIKVTLQPDYFQKRTAYYILECKRIDGSDVLNAKYVNEGIKRFTTKKYSSYYGKNFMLGFVVEDINIKQNTKCIEQYQNKSIDQKLHGQFEVVYEKENIVGKYICMYRLVSETIELAHIFYNFSNVME